MYEKSCYVTKLDNIVWKHDTYESARKHAEKLATVRVGAPKWDRWKYHYEGFISDWQLFRTEIPNIDVRVFGE